MDIPPTRFKMAAKVRRFGKLNGWSSCVGEAVMANDVRIQFAWCGPTCRRRPNQWYFIPIVERRYRDRGDCCFNLCSEWDVPFLLRIAMQASARSMKQYRRCHKDPRVSDELQALALGCLQANGFDPLIDRLIELGVSEDQLPSIPCVAPAIVRWEWPFGRIQ